MGAEPIKTNDLVSLTEPEQDESITESAPTSNWHFLLPLFVYLLLSGFYLFAIPFGESPDEPGHLQCIEQVAQFQRLPVTEPLAEGDPWWARGRIVAGQMCYHMPLYYLVAGTTLLGTAVISDLPLTYTLPPSDLHFPTTGSMFLHENKVSFWQLEEPITITGLRLLSISLGLLVVWVSYRLTRILAPTWPLFALFAATLTAGWPQFVYLSRAINNDVLATALAVLLLLAAVYVGRPYRFILLALLAALATFSKLSIIFTVGFVLLLWVVEFVRFNEQRPAYRRSLLISLGIWALLALVLWTNPVLNRHVTYSATAFSPVTESALTLTYWEDVLIQTLSSGFARFGWMNVIAPFWQAVLWWGIMGITGVAGFIILWRGKQSEAQRLQLFILLFWFGAILLAFARINANRFQPQFRFMLALLPLLAACTAVGMLYGIRQNPRVQWGGIFLLSIILISYNIWLIFSLVQQTYGWQL